MTPSKTLFYFFISFIVGIYLASLYRIPQIFSWGIFVLSILAIIISLFLQNTLNDKALPFRVWVVFGFCMLFLALGIFRFQISQFAIDHNALRSLNDKSEKISLIGVISSEPDVRDNVQKLTITTESVMVNGKEVPIKGKVLVSVDPDNMYQYLDTVKITGKLKTPVVLDHFSYKNYLMVSGIYSIMDLPTIKLVSSEHHYTIFSYPYEKILFLKSKLLGGITKSLSPPHSFMLEGMVFGNDKNMPKELKNQFNVTGLAHITAVSGANIVIIINMLIVLLLALGLWRGQAFYGTVVFVWIYIALIGFPASGVRAAIMGCMALLAQKFGRQHATSRVLVATAGVMLIQNPLLLLYDVGFQLSFLAILGIIHIKPLIDSFLIPKSLTKSPEFSQNHPSHPSKLTMIAKKQMTALLGMVSITLSAQIITLPIIVYNFGMISLIAPLSNLLVLPAVEALTVLGFLLSIGGALSPILGFVFAIPCWFLLSYVAIILDMFSKPWAVAHIAYVPWFFILLYYIALFAAITFLKKFTRLNSFYQG